MSHVRRLLNSRTIVNTPASIQPRHGTKHSVRPTYHRRRRLVFSRLFFRFLWKGYGLDMEKEIGVGLQANGEYRGRCVAHMDAIYWVKR